VSDAPARPGTARLTPLELATTTDNTIDSPSRSERDNEHLPNAIALIANVLAARQIRREDDSPRLIAAWIVSRAR
jgi:hypothetical protein